MQQKHLLTPQVNTCASLHFTAEAPFEFLSGNHLYSHSNLIYSMYFCFLTLGAFHAFDKDGDGIIKLNVLEVNCFMTVYLTQCHNTKF